MQVWELHFTNRCNIQDNKIRPAIIFCLCSNQCGLLHCCRVHNSNESASSIREALDILKQWNPTRNPPVILCDYSEAEISAIKSAFTSTSVYLCDFHREQAWTRWVSNSQHGLTKSDAEILLTLRQCTWASSSEVGQGDANYREQVNILKASHARKNNARVRSWLSSAWLKVPEVSKHT